MAQWNMLYKPLAKQTILVNRIDLLLILVSLCNSKWTLMKTSENNPTPYMTDYGAG